MATTNAPKFCDRAGQNYGWEAAKVERFKKLLMSRDLYGESVPQDKFAAITTEFVNAESGKTFPPEDVPFPDTS